MEKRVKCFQEIFLYLFFLRFLVGWLQWVSTFESVHIMGWNYYKAHSPTASPLPKTITLDQERRGKMSRLFRKTTQLLCGQPRPPEYSCLLKKSIWRSSVVHATPNTNALETIHCCGGLFSKVDLTSRQEYEDFREQVQKVIKTQDKLRALLAFLLIT